MNLILFLSVIIISFIVVRIGAVAFHLTGVEWSLAKFQALSCFSGTGFTTREAEIITSHPRRRRIASTLMVLGNAGLVTLIATFANSLSSFTVKKTITLPLLHLVFPSSLLPWINLVIIIAGVYIIYRIFTNSKVIYKLTNILKARLIKRDSFKKVTFEELLVATGGYGVSTFEVCKDTQVLDKTLLESELKKKDIVVLAIERGEDIIPNPPADTKILLNDRLICFGKLEQTKKELVC